MTDKPVASQVHGQVHSQVHSQGHDEEGLAALIRQGGAREQPPAGMEAAVRAAVSAEWREVVTARARRRRGTALRWSAAAAAAAAGLSLWLAMPLMSPEAEMMASMERVDGLVLVDPGGLLSRSTPATPGARISPDTGIHAYAGGRAAFTLGASSVRVDENTVVAVLSPQRLQLRKGRVYIDAGGDSAGLAPLVVETSFGDVRHLGTQYETRVTDAGLRVRVREGRVQLDTNGKTLEGAAGEQLTLMNTGAVERAHVATTGADWAWAEGIAPSYDINDRPLMGFLRWVSRETGRPLIFGSPESERLANEIIMRGSVRGLSPSQALSAVLTTTRLRSSHSGPDLLIDLKTDEL